MVGVNLTSSVFNAASFEKYLPEGDFTCFANLSSLRHSLKCKSNLPTSHQEWWSVGGVF
jgi:hypothetical protein